METRTFDPSDAALLRRFWAIGKAAEDASRPYDFYPPWESFRQSMIEGREDLETVLIGAFVDDQMCGGTRIDLSVFDNLHSASATYYVDPDATRQGIGRGLAEVSFEVARGHGRRLMLTEAYAPMTETSGGVLFAQAMGFTIALEDGMKIVDLPATEPTWPALAAKVAPRHTDYRLVTWVDRLPDEHVADYCRLNELFFEEAPMGELEVENEKWDEARVRLREERNARQGRHDVCAGAVSPDGRLVGLTEVGLSDHAPQRGFQSGTLVDPAHRGHGLGLAIKLRNHVQVRTLFPQCRLLLTGNARVNAPMNAVNDELGYREIERCIELQRPL